MLEVSVAEPKPSDFGGAKGRIEMETTHLAADSSARRCSALDIGTHFARAFADGRYAENKAWKYGRKEKRRPNDPIPAGAKFGGQYSMSNPKVSGCAAGDAP